LRLKDNVREAGRFAAVTGRAGAAWLGVEVLVGSADPALVLASVAVTVMVGGGIAATARGPVYPRIVPCIAAVILARLIAGPLAAFVVTGLVALGWALRVTRSDAILGLGAFGVGAAALGMASFRLLVVFWALGAVSTAAARAWRRLRRARLPVETDPVALLAREN
jgi:hypothetical protein